ILAPFAHLPMMQLVALVVLACLPFVGKAASHIDVVQSITTDGRCQFFHTFEIDGTQYLVEANEKSGTNFNVDSKIYRWDGTSFVEFQSIATSGALGWESFIIDGTQYLVVANYYDGASYNTNSKVYRWNGTFFADFQSIATDGANSWESFIIDGTQYLVVANYQGADSKVYRWNGASFVEFQSIATQKAWSWESFIIDGTQYLVVANYNNGADSKVYRWDGTSFVEFQSIATDGAATWESFIIDGTQYLVVANSYDHGGASYNVDSKIYRWDGTSFTEFQSIATSQARAWESFIIHDTLYLVVANRYNGASFSVDSKVYRWDGTSFVEFESIATDGASGWESFIIDGAQYLVMASNSATGYPGYVYTVTIATTTTRTMTMSTSTSTSRTSISSTSTSWTSTSSTSTSRTMTSTTTRTEPPSALASSQFAFADASAWGLGALAFYLAALAVSLVMARLWARAGEAPAQVAQEARMLGKAIPDPEHQTHQIPGAQDHEQKEADTEQTDPPAPEETMPMSRRIRRSCHVLTLNMVLESGNLVSSLLYVLGAYQRSTLMGFTAACGSGLLMPVRSRECPNESEILALPTCHQGLLTEAFCEADIQVPMPGCHVSRELDNCGRYDIYSMQMMACSDIGCSSVAFGLWFVALMSLGLTIVWTAVFYARTLVKRLEQSRQQLWQRRICGFMTSLLLLILITYIVGIEGGTSSVLAMALLCPLLLLCAWVLALDVTFLPEKADFNQVERAEETEPELKKRRRMEAVMGKAAALEIPFFNALMAINLKEDDVELLHEFRGPLNTGLRVVEDIPELLVACLDLYYFGGAWYAWLGMTCSFLMIAFHLCVGMFLTCREEAKSVAQRGYTMDTE
ncbi:unnamed protein product, partial [Durusdinium trenchii]